MNNTNIFTVMPNHFFTIYTVRIHSCMTSELVEKRRMVSYLVDTIQVFETIQYLLAELNYTSCRYSKLKGGRDKYKQCV